VVEAHIENFSISLPLLDRESFEEVLSIARSPFYSGSAQIWLSPSSHNDGQGKVGGFIARVAS